MSIPLPYESNRHPKFSGCATSRDHTIDRCQHLSVGDFHETYLRHGRPVHIKRALEECSALSRWDLDYLRKQSGRRLVALKKWRPSGITTVQRPLSDYLASLECYEAQLRAGEATDQRPPYLHDVPLTSILPDANSDLEAFPYAYFPAWYGSEWWKFAQLFLGPTHSFTPLHFDCLLTHNLFFQIRGIKKFILISRDQLKFCYPHNWRWSKVDAEQPDYEKYPLYRRANPIEVIVEPGDALYIPPGTFHYVRSLDCALSFNIDWHTKKSALAGILGVARGMPWKNVYYNLLIAFGLWGGIPSQRILPYYGSYLNYVS
jgi:hypothetical protein